MHRTLNKEQKDIYVESLAYMLNVEENPASDRMAFMESKLKDLGVDSKTVKKIKNKSAESVGKKIKTINEIRVKRFILREMILLAISDHELRDKEIDEIYKIGLAAGIREDKISDFFIWAARGLEWQIEGTQLIEEDI